MTYDKHKVPVYLPEEGYDKYANFYDKDTKNLDSIDQGFLSFVGRKLDGKKVLDVGCGTGRQTIRLFQRGVKIEGFDISEEMLNVLKKKCPQIPVKKGAAKYIAYDDESFEGVVCNFLFVHLKNPVPILEEIYRVLKNDGEFFISIVHQRKTPILKNKEEKFRVKSFFYSARKVRKFLEEQAFQILHEEWVEENDIHIASLFRCRK